MTFDEWAAAWWSWVTAISWQLALFVALTAIATFAFRNARPGIRHTLWLLVLLKIFLPTSMSAAWSLTNWLVKPETQLSSLPADGSSAASGVDNFEKVVPNVPQVNQGITVAQLFGLWLVGVVFSVIVVTAQYHRLRRKAFALPTVDEGPVRVALEKAALCLNIEHPPELRIAGEAASPFLIGTFRPSIVIPRTFVEDAETSELETVLLHELVHWRHRDTWIGWIQVAVQCLLWFHPCVWLANACLNHERETVCDEGVLRSGGVKADRYGETILRVLTLARGRSMVASGLVGVFERGGRIQNRLESIMNFDADRKTSGIVYQAAVLIFAITFLPLAPWTTDSNTLEAANPQPQATTTAEAPPAEVKETKPQPQEKVRPKTSYPQIVKIQPEPGSTDIDPALKELRITFDRDMGKGMSWTGGGPEFPPVDKSRKAGWVDKRTCVLPVNLKRAAYYRVGINSKSFQNFKSANGTPTPPSAIFFTTKGASRAQQNRVRIPKIVEISPANNATDVSAATQELRVTFNMPMGGGMSWTGGGKLFPEIPKGKSPSWSKDGRTCTLPVTLKSGYEYKLGLNSLSHRNFQSKWGVPASPVVYSFKTAE